MRRDQILSGMYVEYQGATGVVMYPLNISEKGLVTILLDEGYQERWPLSGIKEVFCIALLEERDATGEV